MPKYDTSIIDDGLMDYTTMLAHQDDFLIDAASLFRYTLLFSIGSEINSIKHITFDVVSDPRSQRKRSE